MEMIRSSGILLHPTSLPGPYGVGVLGSAAYEWVDFLVETRQTLWQVLPLGPTGYGDSPYQSFSTFAGNPYLICLDTLVREGLLDQEELDDAPDFPEDKVDFGLLYEWKLPLLYRAAAAFAQKGSSAQQAEFDAFCADNQAWLDDYALFMAIKDA
ncbi:MAG: 4-alpha-glucanotransferase, partial [Caldilineae bacterium]